MRRIGKPAEGEFAPYTIGSHERALLLLNCY
jgi:hypothetical protein